MCSFANRSESYASQTVVRFVHMFFFSVSSFLQWFFSLEFDVDFAAIELGAIHSLLCDVAHFLGLIGNVAETATLLVALVIGDKTFDYATKFGKSLPQLILVDRIRQVFNANAEAHRFLLLMMLLLVPLLLDFLFALHILPRLNH